MAASSSSTVSSPMKSSFDPSSTTSLPNLNLLTFVNSVPPQLTLLLASLGPHIARIRWLSEVFSWKTSYADSWLVIAGWWAVCMLSEFTFRYMLLICAAAAYVWLSARGMDTRRKPPTTEQNLQATVVDLSVIESLLPTVVRPPVLPWSVLLRSIAILYIPYLLLSFLVRAKIIIGLLGTFVIVWRAPWARTMRYTLWRSSWFRWGLSRAWGFLSGQTPQTIVVSGAAAANGVTGGPSQSTRFLFTVYENQRWWMGLDWTAALLPGERPSWCSATFEPISPPSAFSLPSSSYVIVADGNGGMVKRTASWHWEEGEWKVVVKKENTGVVKRVEKEPPALREEALPYTNKAGKMKHKMAESVHKLKNPSESDAATGDTEMAGDVMGSPASSRNEGWHAEEEEDCDDDAEPNTDNDGWVYGDNKWKASSHSNGIGKYTRYRKWTRIAVLTEVVEPVSAEEAQQHAAHQHREAADAAAIAKRASSQDRSSSTGDKISDSPQQAHQRRATGGSTTDDENEERTGLRKRLKAAIRKTTI